MRLAWFYNPASQLMTNALRTNGVCKFSRIFKACLCSGLALISIRITNGQTINSNSPAFSTPIAPGQEFYRSKLHNIFWGKHYRDEWSTPVIFSNFYLDTAFGGLLPVEESGSRQSNGLRLRSRTGKEYVLRSIDKNFGRAFPNNYQGTVITHIAKDQSSISHPFSAITITPMIAATGIYHTNPRVVFLPPQKALGKYNQEYSNQLYLFEERPDGDQTGSDNFGNSKNVVGSEKLMARLYEDNDNQIDQKAFAKARLFDMFIGDWGRHPDNWRWAKFENGKKTVYRPVPRDRDQAYTKFDGFWPWIATNVFGAVQYETFGNKVKNIKRFNEAGWVLDRPYTNQLVEQDWVDVAKDLQTSLTDSVIEAGIRELPPKDFAISGDELIATLKSRRDRLVKDARNYYRFLSHHVEIRGSGKKELFEINRLTKNNVVIKGYKITRDDGVKKEPFYSRTFEYSQTREIRLYSLGDSDVIKETGAGRGVKVRVIDPAGSDSILRSSARRTKLSVGKKFVFDTAHTKKFDFFILPLFSPVEYKIFEDDPMVLFPETGVRISFNARYLSQPWRSSKYMHSHIVSANYGVLRSALNIGYIGKFGHAVGPFDLVLKARYDVEGVENYFGAGNETKDTNTKTNYYRTFTRMAYAGIGLSKTMGRYQTLNISTFYRSVKVQNTADHFSTTDHGIDTSLFSNHEFAGIEAFYHLRKVNNSVFPTAGVDFLIAGDYMQNLEETGRAYSKLTSGLTVYIPLSKSFSLATRAGGSALVGDVDFYDLNKLDGYVNLRGFDRERFAGKTVFFNNNELRWVTPTKNYIFNGRIGLLAFYDDGRVWQPLEKSKTWHFGYGAGVILIPFEKAALTATYCTSVDGNFIQLKAGLFF